MAYQDNKEKWHFGATNTQKRSNNRARTRSRNFVTHPVVVDRKTGKGVKKSLYDPAIHRIKWITT